MTLAVATAILGASLPLLPLGAVVGVTAATNAWLAWRSPAPSPRAVPALLTLDTLLLTALLGLSGGPGNPFTALYVVHVALAAVALPAVWTWWTVALSGACYAGLFWLHVPLQFGTGGPSVALQTAGWGVAVLLVAAVTATFIAPVSSALRARESQLSAAEARAARSEWLASLAALAAGTAHELGTPLGTIAVAARELERVAETVGGASEDRVVDDARLIRTQVDRCRAILDRLSALDPGGGGRPAPIALSQLLAGVHEEGDPGEGAPSWSGSLTAWTSPSASTPRRLWRWLPWSRTPSTRPTGPGP